MRIAALALTLAGLTVVAAACGDDNNTPAPAPVATDPMTTDTMTHDPMTTDTMTHDPMTTDTMSHDPMTTTP